MMFQKAIDHATYKFGREGAAVLGALLRNDVEPAVTRLEGQAVMTRETVEDAALLISLALATLGLCLLGSALVLASRETSGP